MTVRGVFNFTRQHSEQDLVESMIIESIQQRGVDVNYIIREMIDPDYLLGEAPISKFKDYVVIEMYIDLVTQYNGDGDMFSGYGMSFSDHMEFIVSSRRFKEELESEDIIRPREGDLIYLPMSDSLWEISKVKQDHQYYQLGKNYTYRVICNLFQYSHEDIDVQMSNTDIMSVDELLGTSANGLQSAFGISPDDVREQSSILQDNADQIIKFDPDVDFQF